MPFTASSLVPLVTTLVGAERLSPEQEDSTKSWHGRSRRERGANRGCTSDQQVPVQLRLYPVSTTVLGFRARVSLCAQGTAE